MRIFVYESVCAGGLGVVSPASLQCEGWAMLEAVIKDFQRLPDVEVMMLLDERLPFRPGHRCTVTRWQDESARFRDLAAGCDWTLVIAPECGNLLLDRSQSVLDVGGHLLGSFPEGIVPSADKWAAACEFLSSSVPHPRTQLLDSDAFLKLNVPSVLKPRHGAGSQATFLVREPGSDVLRAARAEWSAGDFIVQDFVEGESASVSVMVGKGQTIALLPGRQQLSSDGRFRYEGGSFPLPRSRAERAKALAVQAVSAFPGLRGWVGVDLVLGGSDCADGDYVIEINPRLTTSYIGCRHMTQNNLAQMMLDCAQDRPMHSPAWSEQAFSFSPNLPAKAASRA